MHISSPGGRARKKVKVEVHIPGFHSMYIRPQQQQQSQQDRSPLGLNFRESTVCGLHFFATPRLSSDCPLVSFEKESSTSRSLPRNTKTGLLLRTRKAFSFGQISLGSRTSSANEEGLSRDRHVFDCENNNPWSSGFHRSFGCEKLKTAANQALDRVQGGEQMRKGRPDNQFKKKKKSRTHIHHTVGERA